MKQKECKERRQLEIYVCRIVLFIGLSEQAILIFECSYLATWHYFEVQVLQRLVYCNLSDYLVGGVVFTEASNRYSKYNDIILGLLKFEEDCKNCKKSTLCTICHCCQSDSNHYTVLQMCLTQPEIQQQLDSIKSHQQAIVCIRTKDSYTASVIIESMNLHTLLEATVIAVLFVNCIFCILIVVFWRKFSSECKCKQDNILHQSSDRFQEIIQHQDADPIIEEAQVRTGQKQQLKKLTIEQQELEDKGSLNVSINEYISPGLQRLKSSLTPSPGKYRSGKILDFLEKKLSHAKLSQQDICRGVYSKEFSKKYTTEQAMQISVDFGDCFDDQSNKQRIEREIKNHNFLQQTKFLS